MPGAGHEVDAEPLEVEDRVGRGDDLQLTTIAAPGVHLADVEGAPEPPLDPLFQLRGRFLQARSGQRLHPSERGPARGAVNVEGGALCELLPRVRRHLELTSCVDRALGAGLDTLAALDAEGVRKGQRLTIGRRAVRLESRRRAYPDALVAGGAGLEVDHGEPERGP